MTRTETRKHFKMPIHVVKKLDLSKKSYWTIKVIGILIAFLLSGLLCTIFAPGTFVTYYEKMAYGIINPKNYETFMLFLETAGLLLLIAFALAPAFKMKFWNIGAEGQISIGCLVTAGIMFHMTKTGDNSNQFLVVFLCLLFSVLAGIIWALIPALFKAFFNTNETLFTLMMNYVAITLISIFISIWIKSGSQAFPSIHEGQLEDLFGMKIKYLWNLIFVVVIVALMIVYLKKTKHGYELSVVGASLNTARYVGINTKKVIIRTMILSGAICGLVGFLLVSGHEHSLNPGIANGRGFTGVLVAWLGQFEPASMALYAVLVAMFQCGSGKAASYVGISRAEFSAIVTGMFFLIIIATEFFIDYKVLVKEDSKLKPVVDKINNFFSKVGGAISRFFDKINFFKKLKKKKLEDVQQTSKESEEDK